MEETVNQRLKILVRALGTNPGALAKILGVSDSTIRNYIDRDSKPGYEVLYKLYHSFKQINLPWLFGEPGLPILPDPLTQANENNATDATHKNFSNSQVISGKGHKGASQQQGVPLVAEGPSDVVMLQALVEQLRSQLADKERIIKLLEKNG